MKAKPSDLAAKEFVRVPLAITIASDLPSSGIPISRRTRALRGGGGVVAGGQAAERWEIEK
eukprot:CAMPEP_0174888852 /NCGR_PEP_ID=MMETSP0167-20121228/4121_1 /TAXON_ID=38298 /ORGANISM="Rhodella maculata, Strain CCMP736" /LENGTH=60 /DNA_ID=CAMNT_0016126023 /DNA_START=271 /DNA_END=451 /DNA_ORIENTATION=+